ncbi:sensor histidine kinase [Vibrio japonicus]|uniref:histidine kinase n=1 Tax=Vibrio japonicus TaxID=1824638 RepID=A0ABY5LGP8_9VIBR|nr:sensor histidine kinase KdpD [Vibrio japonicus]UUM31021.1 sensor histidine kinase KdpD [Vibrio japonicus]
MTDEERSQKAQALLSQIHKEDQGKLTIFIGAAPGVGKTYAMLNAAKECVQQGMDVLVGLVETHGRKETEAMLDGLDVLPRNKIDYQTTTLTEFDLDAALARKPELVLVDELAHTNVPGSRHKRRCQDISELLEAGIDVYTTVNVQHLSSLNDVVTQLTGVTVRETVPDNFIDDAYEIRFIDLPPVALIERLRQGKVYLPEYARLALDTFFSVANLTALRELTMKRVISKVDASWSSAVETQQSQGVLALKDHLLVLISASSDHRYLVRIGRQIAERRQMPWRVVWVDKGKPQTTQQRKHLNDSLELAKELGANVDVLRGSGCYHTILPYLKEQRVNTVLVGTGGRYRWLFWKKRLYQRLIESGLPLEVSVYREQTSERKPQRIEYQNPSLGNMKGYLYAGVSVALASGMALLLKEVLSSGNLVLVFVLAIILTGLKFGARPAIASAIYSFLSFNFFLTEPIFTLKVYSQDDIATLIFLIIIGLVSGPTASRIRHQFMLLKESNRYAESLRELAQQLAIVESDHTLWNTVCQNISSVVQSPSWFVLQDREEIMHSCFSLSTQLEARDESAIDWALAHGQPAGRFTDTLNASKVTVIPAIHQETVIGVVVIGWQNQQQHFLQFDRDLINSMLNQASNTWQRIRLSSDLESARVKTEVEQIRSSLLSSVSHDLKSPLAAMMGAAETLKELDTKLNASDKMEMLDTILQESRRLDSYIQNLLDMTRLGYGGLKIERDWVSIDDIISSAQSRLKRYFPESKVQFISQKDAPLLYVHAALVEQALFNILENAARYSPKNEQIAIKLNINRDKCLISIEDKGPGIPQDQQAEIFNMFYVVSDGDHKKNNTGMGLAICKGMISAHGGKVRATNRIEGNGTRFEVELPLEYPSLVAT